MITVCIDQGFDICLALIHALLGATQQDQPADSIAGAQAALLRAMQTPGLDRCLAALEDMVAAVDSNSHALVGYLLSADILDPHGQSADPRVGPELDAALRRALRDLLAESEVERIWHAAIEPAYAPHLGVFREWLDGHNPAALVSAWVGEPLSANYRVVPTFFLPPPPDGRAALLRRDPHDRSLTLHTTFGVPRFGALADFGMHRAWLRRGLWHYVIKDVLERYPGRSSHSYERIVEQIMEYYGADRPTAQRYLENYLGRGISTLALEEPADRLRALTHLRGSGYLAAPWMLEALSQAREGRQGLAAIVAAALPSFGATLERGKRHSGVFAGPIESCALEYWSQGALIVADQRRASPDMLRRLRALGRFQNVRLVDVAADRWAAGSHWLVGAADEPHIQAALAGSGVSVGPGWISAFGEHVRGDDLLLTFLRRHPSDSGRWSLVTTATSQAALARLGRVGYPRDADYVIATPDGVAASGTFGPAFWGIAPIGLGALGEWPAAGTRRSAAALEAGQ